MDVVLSSAYLPPVYYFSQIKEAETVYIEQHENYIKQSYRNRCSIYSANGVQSLSIPLQKISDKEKITDKKISYSENWQQVHWRSIISAYKSSPFFEYFERDFIHFYNQKFTFLFDYNMELLHLLLKLLRINCRLEFTKVYVLEYPGKMDFRTAISPKNNLEINSLLPDYYQLFANKHGFIPNLSIIDLLFNEGKYASDYLSVLKQ